MRIKKIFLGLAAGTLAALPAALWAAAPAGALQPANNDVSNQASLQRGARNFVNYCLGCHSARYVRYNRIAADLGLTEAQVRSEEHTSELQSRENLVCRLLLEK